MGDVRYARPFDILRGAADKSAALRDMEDDDVVRALAHASREPDPYLANVLASEAMNRMRRARTMLRHLGEGVIAIDLDGRVTDANAAAERLLGVPRGTLLGANEHAAFHARTLDGRVLPMDACLIRVALKETRVGPLEVEEDAFVRGDGTVFPVSYSAAPIVREGTVEGAVVAFHDISDRRAREEDLRSWHALVETFYHVHDRLGIGLLLVDGERLVYANDAFRTMVGRSLDELRAQGDLMQNVHPEDRSRVMETFGAIIGGLVPNVEQRTRLLRSDATTADVWVLVTAVNTLGGIPRLVCVVRPTAAP